jgi:hypothetical protein
MPLISYTPGQPGNIFTGKTIGPTNVNPKVNAVTPPTLGVTPPPGTPQGNYTTFGRVGYFADAGETADCMNQLVVRLEALESLLNINPNYPIVTT